MNVEAMMDLFASPLTWAPNGGTDEHPTVNEFLADLSEDAGGCAYGEAALEGVLEDIATCDELHPSVYGFAARFVELAKHGCWSAKHADALADAVAAERDSPARNPGNGAAEFWEALTSALARGVEAKSKCDAHDGVDDVFEQLSPGPLDGLLTGLVTRIIADRKGNALVGKIHDASGGGIADLLLKKVWTAKGETLTRTWAMAAYEWHTTHWEPIQKGSLEHSIHVLLGEARVRKQGKWVKYQPTTHALKEIAGQIRSKTALAPKIGPGFWIDSPSGRCPVGKEQRRYLSFSNGILDLDANEVLPHESAYFNTHSMHFDYDLEATAPLWAETLAEWFPGDEEARDALEEVLGYLLLGGMEHDKIFVFLGLPRSGKGTVMRLLNSMVGSGFATQSFDELGDRFGKEDLIGLTVCHISEAVSTRDARRVVSMLKSISGQDDGQTVKRKGIGSVDGVNFTVRFVMTGNEEIVLPDESGVIIDRLVAINFQQSFLDKENHGLTEALIAESPGIFNRLRVAYERLSERGRFVQPTSADDLLSALRRKSAPNKAWFTDVFEVTKDEADFVEMGDAVSSYLTAQDKKMTEREAQMAVAKLLPVGVSSGRRSVGPNGARRQARVIFGVKFRDDDD